MHLKLVTSMLFFKGGTKTHCLLRKVQAIGIGLFGLLRINKGSTEHLKASMSYLAKSIVCRGRPVNLTIEPTNICNCRCEVCETGSGKLGRKRKILSFEEFKAIMNQVAGYTNTLMFYFMGEPFLNKESYQMIKYAKELGIPWVTSCTNCDLVEPEKLVNCGIDEINFQIGGATQESHSRYRQGSCLEKVKENIKETVRLKNDSFRKLRITVEFIIMKHNENEVELVRKMATELGVDDFSVISPCVRNLEQGKQFLPVDKSYWIYCEESFSKGVLKPRITPKNECPWIYYAATIMADGSVVPCCRDAQGDFVMGNIFDESFSDIWNNNKFQQFRHAILHNQQSLSICRLCSSYGASRLK